MSVILCTGRLCLSNPCPCLKLSQLATTTPSVFGKPSPAYAPGLFNTQTLRSIASVSHPTSATSLLPATTMSNSTTSAPRTPIHCLLSTVILGISQAWPFTARANGWSRAPKTARSRYGIRDRVAYSGCTITTARSTMWLYIPTKGS